MSITTARFRMPIRCTAAYHPVGAVAVLLACFGSPPDTKLFSKRACGQACRHAFSSSHDRRPMRQFGCASSRDGQLVTHGIA